MSFMEADGEPSRGQDKEGKWLAKLDRLRNEKKLKKTKEGTEVEPLRDSSTSIKKMKKNKKKKKSKKRSHKKQEKDKPRWKKSNSSDCESGSETDSGGVWVECERVGQMETSCSQRQRDAWMLAPLPSTKMFSKEQEDRDEPPEADVEEYHPSHHSRELNPFWKDGGSGLPTEYLHERSVPKVESPVVEQTSDEDSPPYNEVKAVEMERPVTDGELNKLGAKVTRAELMGDDELAAKLRDQLKDLQERKSAQDKGPMKRLHNQSAPEETVLLTHSDRHGNIHPLRSSCSDRQSHKRRRGNDSSHGKDGKRNKYFDDDEEYSLQDLIAQEKRTSADAHNRSVNKMAGRHVEKMGADQTLDDIFVSSASRRAALPQDSEKDKARALQEHRQLIRSKLSIDSPELQKQLIVCIGMKVYLAVPPHQPLVPGHCQLIPTLQCSCVVNLDEDVWAEVKVFRKGLVAMFASRDQDVIFIETATHLRRQPHMVLDCIPVPKEQGHLAPLYFKKAILECESEWAQNKKLLDTRHKELRRSVPRGFPYFSAEFGLDGGYAHVIEDEGKFTSYFGKEIIGGMLELEPKLWRKPQRESTDQQKHRAMQISEMWEQYDWTKRLKNTN